MTTVYFYEECPLCEADLRADPIPGEPERHYLRTIGVCVPGVYDGVLYWQCPDCGGAWHRWNHGTWRYERADELIRQRNDGVAARLAALVERRGSA